MANPTRKPFCGATGCWIPSEQDVGGVDLCPAHLRAVREALGPAPKLAIVYFLSLDGGLTVKIGTTKNPRERFLELSKKATGDVQLLAACPGSFAEERATHYRFRHFSTGKNEYFRLCPELHIYMEQVRREWPAWEELERSLKLDELPRRRQRSRAV